MDEQRIQTVADVVSFLSSTIDAPMVLHGSKDELYSWVEETLVRFRYLFQNKKGKSFILRYVEQFIGVFLSVNYTLG